MPRVREDLQELVSAHDIGGRILKALVEVVNDAGGDIRAIRRIETDEGLRRKLGELIVGDHGQPPWPSFKVTINRDQALTEMLAAGRYDWVNEYITQENFPVKGSGIEETEIFLLNFDRTVSSETAIEEMRKQNLKPADPAQLLALGATHPDLQRQYPITVLGQTWRHPDGFLDVVCLDGYAVERRMDLGWFGDGWDPDWRFAAVRA